MPHQLSKLETSKLLGSIQIPPQPEIVRALLVERAKDDPDTQRIAWLVSSDAGLTAAVLKTVNSPYYGLRNKVSSVQQAISILGMKNIGTLVMGLALRTSISVQGVEDFWESTSRIAQLANLFVRHLGLRISDEAQLYALFHDCAMPLLLQRMPTYRDTIALIPTTGWVEVTSMEDARHNTNHAVVGGLLASNWELPETVREAIRWHHDPAAFTDDGVSSEIRTLIAVGHVAKKIEEMLSMHMNDNVWDAFGVTCLRHLMLGEDELQEFIDAARDQFAVHRH